MIFPSYMMNNSDCGEPCVRRLVYTSSHWLTTQLCSKKARRSSSQASCAVNKLAFALRGRAQLMFMSVL